MKVRFFNFIIICLMMGILVGCGGRTEPGGMGEQKSTEEQKSAEVSKGTEEQEEQEEQEELKGTTELDNAGGLLTALKRMELLQFEDPDNENLAAMLQEAGSGMMVQLQAGKLLGSGVICGVEEDKLLILTAAHVLEEAEGFVMVTFADGQSVSAGDLECFKAGDFAVVRVAGGDIPEDSLEKCLCANVDKESFDAATTGTGCIVMGSRTGVAEEAYEGIILDHWIYMEDYGQYMMWVKAEGKPGMSGGGLFDRQGHFLGILSGGNEDGELAVVPLSLILAEVNLLELNP